MSTAFRNRKSKDAPREEKNKAPEKRNTSGIKAGL